MGRTPRRGERTQAERSAATTTDLVRAARRLFAAGGYAGTSLDDVAVAAGVTKGALYHHFEDKRCLFQEVFEREQQRLAATVTDAYAARPDIWQGFYAGCRAFLEASLEAGVQRITLLDAPAVLGWEGMREIEARYSLALLKRGLEAAMAEGKIASRPAAPLAHMLLGALCEGAMMVARSGSPRVAVRQVLAELKVYLDALAQG